jgi:hypothetical protein
MKKNTLKLYAKLRTSLEREYATLQARLKEIEAALGMRTPAPAVEPAAVPTTPLGKARRKMSAAGRAAIAAAARARWAKIRAARGASSPIAVTKPKRRLSAAGKARIIAATKARWARIRAEKAKAAE